MIILRKFILVLIDYFLKFSKWFSKRLFSLEIKNYNEIINNKYLKFIFINIILIMQTIKIISIKSLEEINFFNS